MRAISSALPFPRGSTYSDGPNGAVTMTATTADELTGRLYVVRDTNHGTGLNVVLRCVRNTTGGSITIDGTAALPQHRIYSFDGDSKDWGTEIDAVTGAIGEVGKPIDDEYPGAMVIVENDLLYVVDEGPTKIVTAAASVANGLHESVTPDALGALHLNVTDGTEYKLGTIDAAQTDEDLDVLVFVNAGLVSPDDNS